MKKIRTRENYVKDIEELLELTKKTMDKFRAVMPHNWKRLDKIEMDLLVQIELDELVAAPEE